jgi:hypothetical protein
MKILLRTIRASGVLTVAVLAALVLLNPGSVQAQARIDGITGTELRFHGRRGRGQHAGRRVHPLLGLHRAGGQRL